MNKITHDIGGRLQEIRRALGLTQEDMGAKLNKGKGSVSKYENGDAEPPYAALQRYVELSGKTFDWIFTGKESRGENNKNLTRINKGECVGEGGVPFGYVKSDVYVLGGAGNPHDLTSQEIIDTIFLPQKFLKPPIVPIQIAGRSMEPTLLNGAFVGVDRDERQVISGEVYAMRLPYEGTVVKRVYMSTDHVILKSDNLSFPELTIPIDKIDPDNFILGRVKWVLQEF